MTPTSLHPLNPFLNPAYAMAIAWRPGDEDDDPLPSEARASVDALVARRLTTPEDEIYAIDQELVSLMWWYVLRPDEIVEATIRHHNFAEPLTVDQATVVFAALGEAGFPIWGNGAPDYDRISDADAPVRGEERDRVIWAAARYWAEMSSKHITYVSLGDSRGFCPRAVQYDNPGSMHPSQQAAVTFGPASDADDECDSHGYMRRHTRRLVLVLDGDKS